MCRMYLHSIDMLFHALDERRVSLVIDGGLQDPDEWTCRPSKSVQSCRVVVV